MFGNIAGLYPRSNQVKVQYLGEKARENKSIIIALTESHLKSPILDAEVQIPGYQLYRTDRQDNINKGGVITYVMDYYASGLKVLTSGCNGVVEWTCLHIPMIEAVFINVYRPPTCGEAFFKDAMENISSAIDQLDGPMPTVIMCGDFNMPFINWESCSIVGSTREMQRQAEVLLEFKSTYCLHQIVTEPTRANNILDLLLTNNPDIIWKVEIDDTVLSDHRLLRARTRLPNPVHQKVNCPKLQGLASLNFFDRKVDWDHLNEELMKIDWDRKFENLDVSEMLTIFIESLYEECTKHVPLKGSHKGRSHIPRDRRVLMRNRANINRNLRVANHRRRNKLIKQLELIEFKLLDSHKNEAKSKENKAVDRIKDNPKYFFAYAKGKSQIRVPIGPLEKGGAIVSDPQEMSGILQEQFVTVFSQPKLSASEIEDLLSTECQGLIEVMVTEANVQDAIEDISSSSAPGPDGVPPLLLKKCKTSLSRPLCLLWNKSLATGKIPNDLKLGLIIPVHKSGPRTEAKNYRPITLTSHLIKVNERIITKKLIGYLEEKSLLNNRQHGFRKRRSCLSQLMDHYQSLLNIMETGHAADVIYLDFAKAFDKVDHGLLIEKLTALGIGGSVLKWIHVFLTNRLQTVKVDNLQSCTADVVSGVPQGTVLGPILFLLFIGDIDSELRFARASSFADDTRVVKEIGNAEDAAQLQADLKTLYEWAECNNMKFNGGKFKHLRYGPLSIDGGNYLTEEQDEIDEVTSLGDLGIIMSGTGNFDDHINAICQRGSNMAGWILRTISTRKSFPMLTMFKALVLPIMEYCCQLWSPHKQYLIRNIEAVQRNFTAKISGTDGLKYKDRLKYLRIYSLERRRDRYMIIYVWKVIQGLAPNMLGRDRIRCADSNPRLGRYCLLPPLNNRAPKYVQTLRENSFSVYGPKLYNELGLELRNFDGSLASFKHKLDVYLATVEDRPYDPTEPQMADSNSLKDQIRYARLKSRPLPH